MGNKSNFGYTRRGKVCPICEKALNNNKKPLMKVDGTFVHVSCHALKSGLASA